MKCKKGFLLVEETLKIIIALISLIFLVYFLTSLYMSNQNSKDLELAKASLEHLVNEIESDVTSVEIYNPEDWVIGVWPHNTIWWGLGIPPRQIKTGSPKSCENLGWKSCICICKKDDKDVCDERGICVNNDKEYILSGNSVEIDEIPLVLNINFGGSRAVITK